MTTSTKFAIAKIRSACRFSPTLATLASAGVVRGPFGVTALRAREIVEQLVKAGELSVSYDDCHVRRFTVDPSVPAGTLITISA